MSVCRYGLFVLICQQAIVVLAICQYTLVYNNKHDCTSLCVDVHVTYFHLLGSVNILNVFYHHHSILKIVSSNLTIYTSYREVILTLAYPSLRLVSIPHQTFVYPSFGLIIQIAMVYTSERGIKEIRQEVSADTRKKLIIVWLFLLFT